MRMKSLDFIEKTILQFTFHSSTWHPQGFIWCFHFGLTFSIYQDSSPQTPTIYPCTSPPPFFFFNVKIEQDFRKDSF